MAKPKRYSKQRVVTLSEETDAQLVAKATDEGKKPAVLARIAIEQFLEKDDEEQKSDES